MSSRRSTALPTYFSLSRLYAFRSAAGLVIGLMGLTAASAQDDLEAVLDREAEWRGDENVYMIAIEALVVEVNEDKTRELGLKYGFVKTELERTIEGGDFVFGPVLNPVQVPTFQGDAVTGRTAVGFTSRLPGLGISLTGMDVSGAVLSARLRALLDQGNARISARPIVLAVNNTSTEIHVASVIPYQDFIFEAAQPTLNIAYEEIGVKMKITPRIIDLNEKTVELTIDYVEVSSLSKFITTRNIDRPVFNKSETQTRVTMRAGETYQLSSLKTRRNRTVREGIPILMYIPFLGKLLFSSHESLEEGVDVLFFITPHIVPPGKNILLPYDFLHDQDLIEHGVKLEN